jgi:hypothetical protein
MGQTPEDQKVVHAEGTTSGDEKAESLKMVDVVNLLQGNLIRTTRLMWGQFLVIGGLIFFLFIIYFSLLSKIPSISNVAVSGQKSLKKPSPASEIISAHQVPQTEAAVRSTDVPERKEVQVILDQVRKAQLENDINLFLKVYSPTFPNLAEKKKSLLKSWQKYNYLDMNFNIENIQKKNAQTIIAEVACDITLEDIHSKERNYLMKDYIINFSEVSGKRLIQGVTQGKKNNNWESSGPNNRLL